MYKDNYRVSTTGYEGKLNFKGDTGANGKGLHDFGDNQEAAIAFAIKAALEQGVITGIRESTKRLLAAGTDLQSALEKATTFENVFVELKTYTDPVGAAVDALDKQFAQLRQIFGEAGASTEEYSQLEALYAFKRADAIKAATVDMTSTLEQFLSNLRTGSDTGLSARTRLGNTQAAFAPYIAAITAGQKVDQDKFTEAAQAMLQVAQEYYGSSKNYFDLLSQVTGLTAKAITNNGGAVTPITAAAAQQTQTIAAATGTAAAAPAAIAGVTGSAAATASNFDLTTLAGQIANDNATLAASIVTEMKAVAVPGDRLSWFTRADLTGSIREAIDASGAGRQAVLPPSVVSAPDVVAGIADQTRTLSTGLRAMETKLDSLSAAMLALASRPAPGGSATVRPSPLGPPLRNA